MASRSRTFIHFAMLIWFNLKLFQDQLWLGWRWHDLKENRLTMFETYHNADASNLKENRKYKKKYWNCNFECLEFSLVRTAILTVRYSSPHRKIVIVPSIPRYSDGWFNDWLALRYDEIPSHPTFYSRLFCRHPFTGYWPDAKGANNELVLVHTFVHPSIRPVICLASPLTYNNSYKTHIDRHRQYM